MGQDQFYRNYLGLFDNVKIEVTKGQNLMVR